MRASRPLGSLVIAALLAIGCGGSDDATPVTGDEGVRIASFDFDESALLAEMYAQLIESTGVPVVRLGRVGPREIIAPAMELDRIDLVPEYLGTALLYRGLAARAGAGGAHAALNEQLAPLGLVGLTPALAQDRNVVVVTAALAAEQELQNVSDLAPVAGSLVFGGPAECVDRPLCLVGLRDVYGLEFASFVPQRSLAFTAEALRRGEIDVGLLFTTAPELLDDRLVALVDDRGLQPPENVVPVIRSEAVDRWGPAVTEVLEALAPVLTTAALRELNLRAAQGEPPDVVARLWLNDQGLLSNG